LIVDLFCYQPHPSIPSPKEREGLENFFIMFFRNKNLLTIAVVCLFIGIVFYSLQGSIEDFKTTTQKARTKYEADILNETDSPIKDQANFKGFKYFEANEKFVVSADYQEVSSNELIAMTDSTKGEIKKTAELSFELEGKKIKLGIFDEGEIFILPFRDLTSGKSTYGGGRYINIQKNEIKDGKVELDFNKAHNFYCAYNETFVCPIPPKDNSIEIAIEAGEKNYK
jgi:uncharacterized protein